MKEDLANDADINNPCIVDLDQSTNRFTYVYCTNIHLIQLFDYQTLI